jgi:hypothetical protein
MAANPKSLVSSNSGVQHYHVYHAEAHLLSGNLKHPIDQTIKPYASVELKNRRANHISQNVDATNLEGLISFQHGHTRASGCKIQKKDMWGNDHSGYVTLSTSVIDGLNLLDVITADHIVSQVFTEHSLEGGHVPRVTFLGTRFENLRIGGYPVDVELDLNICGSKPTGDRSYLQDDGFLDRVRGQVETISGSQDLPKELEKQCRAELKCITDLKRVANGNGNGAGNGYSKLVCSLVKSIGPIPIPGVKIFGNMIFVPDFGLVSLATVEVGVKEDEDTPHLANAGARSSSGSKASNYFTLKMLKMRLGCPVGGDVEAGNSTANGHTAP